MGGFVVLSDISLNVGFFQCLNGSLSATDRLGIVREGHRGHIGIQHQFRQIALGIEGSLTTTYQNNRAERCRLPLKR